MGPNHRTMKNDYILQRSIDTSLGKAKYDEFFLACQMPNLAYFWHFPMVADRAVVPLIKVDQTCKTFSKLV